MMEIQDYVDTADAGEIGTPVTFDRRRPEKDKDRELKLKLNIANVGALGRNIYNDIVAKIQDMVAISGRIHIEVNVGVEDRRWFGDDEARDSKLIIDVEMERRPEVGIFTE